MDNIGFVDDPTKNPLRIKWYSSKDKWRQASVGKSPHIWLKDGKYKFGSYADREGFVNAYVDLSPYNGSLLQLVQESWCRLYMDIEQVFDHVLDHHEERNWTCNLLELLQKILTKAGVPMVHSANVRVDRKSRLVPDGGFKTVFSFRVVQYHDYLSFSFDSNVEFPFVLADDCVRKQSSGNVPILDCMLCSYSIVCAALYLFMHNHA